MINGYEAIKQSELKPQILKFLEAHKDTLLFKYALSDNPKNFTAVEEIQTLILKLEKKGESKNGK